MHKYASQASFNTILAQNRSTVLKKSQLWFMYKTVKGAKDKDDKTE